MSNARHVLKDSTNLRTTTGNQNACCSTAAVLECSYQVATMQHAVGLVSLALKGHTKVKQTI